MTAHSGAIDWLARDHPRILLVAGAIGVAVYHWRRWRRDRAVAERLGRTPRSASPLSHAPKVSALVAAWNEADSIDHHLRSFLSLKYPQIELILCAGGTDGTLDRARRHANERVIVLEQYAGEGKQRALARCLAHASGDIVYLTDADCLYSDEALIRLIRPLVDHGEQAATGAVRPLDRQLGKLLPAYLDSVHVLPSARARRYVKSLRGANTAVSRSALAAIGGLDFAAPIGTDYQLARRLIRAGVKIRHARGSAVPTRCPETVAAYVRAQSRWLRNVLIHAPRHRAHGDLISASLTVGIGTVMIVTAIPVLVVRGVPLIVWSLLCAHATMTKVRHVAFAARVRRQRPPLRLLGTLPLLTLLDFAAWMTTAVDLFRAKKRYRW